MPSRNWRDGNSPWAAQIQAAPHLEEIATTYEIDLHQALQMPWPKKSWKSFCKNAVKCHWSNKMLNNASQKSTLKHVVWNNWIEQAHGIWRVCRERPFLSEAASTRARILVGRINIQASSWIKHKGEDPRCPMCEEEEKDIQHFLVSGLGSIPELELELTSIPIPIPELELELQAMELELELQNGIDRNWNGIEDSISIPPSILFTFSILSSANGTYWCFKNSRFLL